MKFLKRVNKKIIAKKWPFRLTIGIGLLIAAIYLIHWIFYFFAHESTDDAYVVGTVVPICPQVKGQVVKVLVRDNQQVKSGDLLVEIDREDYATRVEEAEKAFLKFMAEKEQTQALLQEKREVLRQAYAKLESAEVEEDLAQKEERRYATLYKQDLISKSQYDHISSQFLVAKANTKSAEATVSETIAAIKSIESQLKTQELKIEEGKAALDLARLDLERTQISAPIAGRIAKKNVDPGKYVQPGQPLFAIVDEKDIWITANFKETQIEKMRVGQPVEIKVDAYPGIVFKGHVDSLQPGTGSVFSLLPPENATGNFVKIVQRLPVKIIIDAPVDQNCPLWPGLSVVPYVAIGGERGAVYAKSKNEDE